MAALIHLTEATSGRARQPLDNFTIVLSIQPHYATVWLLPQSFDLKMAGRLFSFYFCYPRRIISWFLGIILGFPRQRRSKESASQCRRCKRQGLSPWVRKITWRRKRQPTPVFLPKKFYGQRNLLGYNCATIPGVSKSGKRLSMCVCVCAHTHTHSLFLSLPPG